MAAEVLYAAFYLHFAYRLPPGPEYVALHSVMSKLTDQKDAKQALALNNPTIPPTKLIK